MRLKLPFPLMFFTNPNLSFSQECWLLWVYVELCEFVRECYNLHTLSLYIIYISILISFNNLCSNYKGKISPTDECWAGKETLASSLFKCSALNFSA